MDHLRHTTLYYVTNLEYRVIENHLSASGLRLAPHLTHAPSAHAVGRRAGDTLCATLSNNIYNLTHPGCFYPRHRTYMEARFITGLLLAHPLRLHLSSRRFIHHPLSPLILIFRSRIFHLTAANMRISQTCSTLTSRFTLLGASASKLAQTTTPPSPPRKKRTGRSRPPRKSSMRRPSSRTWRLSWSG